MECSIKIEHKADWSRIQRFGIVSAMYCALEDDGFRLKPSAITRLEVGARAAIGVHDRLTGDAEVSKFHAKKT